MTTALRNIRAADTGRKSRWPWVKRGVVIGFALLVIALMVRFAHRIDWQEVWHTLVNLPPEVLLATGALAITGHLLYSCYDLVGRHYTGHRLPTWQVIQVALVSFAFNLNFGSTVGGIGFRLRLYSRLGLPYTQIIRIVTLSMLSNWLGYLLLAGSVFALSPLDLPPSWQLDGNELSLIGIALVAVAIGYVVVCATARRRSFTLRGHEVELPPWRTAVVQIALSVANWGVTAGAVYAVLQGQVPYFTVLSVFLLAAMAGLVVRVPGGLGVLEAVFIALLSHRVPQSQLLGALLAYRALYYMLPLAVASLLYLRMELRARRQQGALQQRMHQMTDNPNDLSLDR